jgi:two-component system phosphate regulon sensor histidine kinase PhoR
MAESNITPQSPGTPPAHEYSTEYYRSQMVILLAREKELQETQRHLQRVVGTLMTLQKITRFLKGTQTIDEGLEYAIRALATEANYERAVVVLRANDSPEVHTIGYNQADTAALHTALSTERLEAFLQEAQAAKESGFLLRADQAAIGKDLLPLLQFDTCLLALISDSKGVIGFIAAGYSPAQAVYFAPVLGLQADDTVWFDELAHQISSTIINLRLVESLKAEQARLSASINSLVLGFMMVDTAHRVVFSNRAVGTILEVAAVSAIQDIAGRFTDVDIKALGTQVMSRHAPVEIDEVLYGAKILRLLLSPITTDKTVIGYIFVVEDVTEAKSMERSREEFFSIASHELRTPLTAIRGNSSLLLKYYPAIAQDPALHEAVTDIHNSSERLVKIVNDFLQVSRLEQNRLNFNLQPVDAAAITQQVLTELKSLADAKKLTIHYDQPNPVGKVLADADHLKEVIINLVGNAISYTEAGSVTVEIAQSGNTVTIRVKDTGVGIEPRNQSLLFHKFQQAGDVLSRANTQSTGLGLYISKLMIEAMKGSVVLQESTPGKGSTFCVTLTAAA